MLRIHNLIQNKKAWLDAFYSFCYSSFYFPPFFSSSRSVLWKCTSQVTEADVCLDDANTVNSGLVKVLPLEEVANNNQDQSPGSREDALFEDSGNVR